MLTWIYEFRPGNKTIYVAFDEESDVLGPRTPKLSLDQVFQEKHTLENLRYFFLTHAFFDKGVWVPLTSPISSPNIFCKMSFSKSLIKICILCTPP